MSDNNSKDDGSPAFPVPTEYAGHGMSLRDYFAAKVMDAQIHKLNNFKLRDEFGCTYSEIAKQSYLVADAMLEARKQ